MPNLDPLTGLPNGDALYGRLPGWVDSADESGEPLSVIIADLGGLRHINERYGREIGDLVLMTAARVLREAVSLPNVCFRLGGDAFVIVLPGSDRDSALETGVLLQAAIAAASPSAHDENKITLSLYVGVATYPADGRSARSLLKRADRRMHATKPSGVVI